MGHTSTVAAHKGLPQEDGQCPGGGRLRVGERVRRVVDEGVDCRPELGRLAVGGDGLGGGRVPSRTVGRALQGRRAGGGAPAVWLEERSGQEGRPAGGACSGCSTAWLVGARLHHPALPTHHGMPAAAPCVRPCMLSPSCGGRGWPGESASCPGRPPATASPRARRSGRGRAAPPQTPRTSGCLAHQTPAERAGRAPGLRGSCDRWGHRISWERQQSSVPGAAGPAEPKEQPPAPEGAAGLAAALRSSSKLDPLTSRRGGQPTSSLGLLWPEVRRPPPCPARHTTHPAHLHWRLDEQGHCRQLELLAWQAPAEGVAPRAADLAPGRAVPPGPLRTHQGGLSAAQRSAGAIG